MILESLFKPQIVNGNTGFTKFLSALKGCELEL